MNVCVSACAGVCVHMQVHAYMYLCAWACARVCVRGCACVCAHTCMCVCVCVRMCASECLEMQVPPSEVKNRVSCHKIILQHFFVWRIWSFVLVKNWWFFFGQQQQFFRFTTKSTKQLTSSCKFLFRAYRTEILVSGFVSKYTSPSVFVWVCGREWEGDGKERKLNVGLRSWLWTLPRSWFVSVLQCVAVCCSVLQCVAVCCSVFGIL